MTEDIELTLGEAITQFKIANETNMTQLNSIFENALYLDCILTKLKEDKVASKFVEKAILDIEISLLSNTEEPPKPEIQPEPVRTKSKPKPITGDDLLA